MSLVFDDCHCLPDTYIRCGSLPKLYGYYEPNGINEEERQKDIGETVSMASTLSLTNNVPPEPKMVFVFIFDRCISPLLTERAPRYRHRRSTAVVRRISAAD